MKLGKKDEVKDEMTDQVQTDQVEQSQSKQADGQSGDAKTDQDLIQVINDQQVKITDLINTAKQTQANFENYRKHTEADMARARQLGEEKTVLKLLPIIDVLDSAMTTMPEKLADNDWAKGIMAAHKNLAKMMGDLKLAKQEVKVGDPFDHNQHEAILFDDGDGETEVIAEVLRPGYIYDGRVLRPAMVKVTK